MQADLITDWRDALVQLRQQNLLRDLDVSVARFLHQQVPDSEPVVLLLAALASAQLAAGHLCLDLDEPGLTQRLWKETPDTLQGLLPAQPAEWLAPLRASSLVSDDGHTPLVLDGSRLYLRRNWAQEVAVAAQIHQRLAYQHPQPNDLSTQLAALFPEDSNAINWQQVACALATRAGLTLITGGPGTGKTTTVVRLLALLQSLALNPTDGAGKKLRIRLAAPTGKAAARLTESIGDQVQALHMEDNVREAIPTDVSTLHRLLGTRMDSRHFRHHQHNPLHADLVVVDEASMIDMDMMASLLAALDNRTRLILLGDKDQLASVEAGAVMGDLCRDAEAGNYAPQTRSFIQNVCGADLTDYAAVDAESAPLLAQQTAMLRKNWRFKDSPGIGELAQAINQGQVDSVPTLFHHHPDSLQRHAAPDNTWLADLLIQGSQGHSGLRQLFQTVEQGPQNQPRNDWAAALLNQLTEQQLLSGLRGGPFGVEALNQHLTDRLRQRNLANDQEWYPGRPVIMTYNDYQLGLMNGDVGLTLPTDSGLRVAFQLPDGRIKWVLPSRLDAVETVYAMTVHKSQGSEFHHTLLVLPETTSPVLTRELVYTAVTRARQSFTLIETGPPSVFNKAVITPTWRASGLAQRLTHPIS